MSDPKYKKARGELSGSHHQSHLNAQENLRAREAANQRSSRRISQNTERPRHSLSTRNRATVQQDRDPESTPSSGRGEATITPNSSEEMVSGRNVMEPKETRPELVSDKSRTNESPEAKVRKLESQIREVRENSDRLSNVIYEKDNEITQLRNQRITLFEELQQAISDRRDFARCQDELARAQRALSMMREEIGTLNGLLDDASAQTSDLRAQLRDLRFQLDGALDRGAELLAENRQLREDNRRLLVRVNELQQEITRISEELDLCGRRLATFEEQAGRPVSGPRDSTPETSSVEAQNGGSISMRRVRPLFGNDQLVRERPLKNGTFKKEYVRKK
ncbi:hypothetical protein BGW36DRAFT_405720 [Talaromyces proteolyticus]|uniref:Uncharacterized protein n=1 Tax=Talaromyces proteolyticus TaxID=1131652 RepID=A0AAD4L062_9EURO|nr:uncharacterized protein BGW36DRAFT_405720 [Talaromyces proteolyticus]KAH8700484.1 hypothetical protein BGW36DRAFT_405720 [Talaromyces proteolyticus]